MHEHALSIGFPATNNEAEYEALIAGLTRFATSLPPTSSIPPVSYIGGLILASTFVWSTNRKCQASFKSSMVGVPVATPEVAPWPTVPFLRDIGGRRWYILLPNHYTKWVEAKVLITIMVADVENFLWKQIFIRFGVPYAIVFDNGTQFVATGSGQVKAANKAISVGLKHRLTNKRGKWATELPDVAATRPTARTINFDVPASDAMLAAEANRIDELLDDAHVKYAAYQQQLAWSYNKTLWTRPFNVDDLVLWHMV
ncbi:uncharacterized protein LOC131327699 [Rhododendron vialii]|uniref:uncharacterized protein LOC131327699 n=1 Tax=Rhododendron vialii TaxID=182163 RepID=UPI00265E1BC1|nr:uncharacterized protein LOC131327699 [Rhododendron vialii]